MKIVTTLLALFLSVLFTSGNVYGAACPASSSAETSGANDGDNCTVTDGSTGTVIQLNFISGFDSTTLIENDTAAPIATDNFFLNVYGLDVVQVPATVAANAATQSKASGNNGTTVGAQRKLAFIKAAEILASKLTTTVPILVDAEFATNLACAQGGATLGSASASSFIQNASAPAGAANSTWYPVGLYNSLSGVDNYPSGGPLNPNPNTVDNGGNINADSDVFARYNALTGTTNCLDSSNGWYYGFDAPPSEVYQNAGGSYLLDGNGDPLQTTYVGFTTVLLHEMLHGLGFSTLTDSSGNELGGIDDIYATFLRDNANNRNWNDPSESAANRVASMTSGTGLLWTGSNVNTAAEGELTAGYQDNDSSSSFTSGDRVQMYAPNPFESGSSVAHFDTAVSPNEIMEPQYTAGSLDIGLALYLLEDLGWSIVAGSNTAPTITAVDQTTNEDTPIANFDASGWASDGDGDTLTFSITSCPSDLTCNVSSDGTDLDITPDANYNGATNTVTIQVSDGNGGTASDNFNVNVTAVDDAPTWSAIPDQTVTEGGSAVALDFSSYVTDVDGDAITGYSIQSCGTGLDCSNLSGSTLNIQATSNGGNTVTITVRADEGDLTSDTTFNVIINAAAANNNPTITAVNQTTLEDTPLNVDVTSPSNWANDVDGDSLSYTFTNCPTNLTCNDSGLTLTPATDFNGTITGIEITVDDGNGGTANDTFDLTVTAVNDAPVMGTISNQSMSLGSTEIINLTSTDVDSGSVTYSVSGSSNAGASITGSTLTLTPIAAGTYSLTVTVDDGSLTDSETFQLTVAAAPSLALNGTALDTINSTEISLGDVSLLLVDGVSNYTITLTFEGQNANHLITSSGTNITIGMPSASDFNGQFAGEYALTLVQNGTGASSEYSLLRGPRLNVSASKLLSGNDTQILTIEGGAANTVYTLNEDKCLITFSQDNSTVTTATAIDDAANFNPAEVAVNVTDVTALTDSRITADSIYATGSVDRDIYVRADFELTIEDSQNNRLTQSSATLVSPDLSDFNLDATYSANNLGVIVIGMPDIGEDITVSVSQSLYVSQDVLLVTSQLEQTVVLAKIATPLTLQGDIEALSPLNYEQTLPSITLNLTNGTSIDIEAVKISNSLARFEYVHDLNVSDIETLVIDHSEGTGLSFEVPNQPGEVTFDIFLQASNQSPTLNNGDGTAIGGSSAGTFGFHWLFIILIWLFRLPKSIRSTS